MAFAVITVFYLIVYGFSRKSIMFFGKQKKSFFENIEDIEILRFFDLGVKIKMIRLNSNSVAVDEISDVKKAEKILKEKRTK